MDTTLALYTTIKTLIIDNENLQDRLEGALNALNAEEKRAYQAIQDLRHVDNQVYELKVQLKNARSEKEVTCESIVNQDHPTHYESIKDCFILDKKIKGVKRMKDFTGAGLKEAKQATDRLWKRWKQEALEDSRGEW